MAASAAVFQGVDGGHVRLLNDEIVDIQILRHPGGRDALGNRAQAVLQYPAQTDLGRRFAVFFRQGNQRLVGEGAGSGHGAPGLGDNFIFQAVFHLSLIHI